MNFSKTSTFFLAGIIAIAMVACNQNKTDDTPELVQKIVSEITENVVEDDANAQEKVASETATTVVADTANAISDDTVLVIDNGQEITYGQIISDIRDGFKMSGLPNADDVDATIASFSASELSRSYFIKMAVKARLFINESQRRGFTATDDEVEKEFEEIKKSPQANENTDFNDQVIVDLIKKQIKATLPLKKLEEELTKDVTTTDEEVLNFYNEHKDSYFHQPERVQASHILIKVDEDATPEAKAEAKAKCEALLAQIKTGADFATLAKENSDCPSKENGGDLGLFTHGQMVPEFDVAAFALEKGAVSDIVETKFGYHIIKVTDKKADEVVPFDEVKEFINSSLQNQKKVAKIMEFATSINESVAIEYTDAYKRLTSEDEYKPTVAPVAEPTEVKTPSEPVHVESDTIKVTIDEKTGEPIIEKIDKETEEAIKAAEAPAIFE